VVTGIGDDCAILRLLSGRELLVTTDFSLEGVHFRRDWQPPESVGHRCLTRGLSDIAAMGGEPLAVFLSLALPADLPQEWVDGFCSGLLSLARRFAVPLAGGDTSQSPNGVLADIMVLGSVRRGQAVLRSGAKPGDRIYVTGELGESAAEIRRRYESLGGASLSAPQSLGGMGLSGRQPSGGAGLLGLHSQAPKNSRALAPEGIGDRFLLPEPRLSVGQKLRSLASAMIDVSDGLSTDISHICEESKVGAILYESQIPVAANAILTDALHGGDDYELLFTSSKRIPGKIAGVPVTEIGEILDRRGQWLQDRQGRNRRMKPRGWQHFSGKSQVDVAQAFRHASSKRKT
jgi:thiamine-monophosphate kinase